MSFIITGQVVGAISDVFGEHSENLSVVDKVMASMGFGRIWFTVNWWNERLTQDGIGKYKVLRQKHKIWDLLYEAFPTVTLQIYAAMTTDVAPTALVASITISAVCVSFSTILYLRTLLGVQQQDNGAEQTATLRVPSLSTESPRNSQQRPDESKTIYQTLFVFLISDFYIRSVPMVMMLAMVSMTWFGEEGGRDYVLRFVLGSFIFGAMAFFELIANHRIRTDSHRGLRHILKIFAASIFSSFYSMLCTLSVLKTDPFYAESVIFSKYLVEHGIRCCVALILCIFSMALSDTNLWYPFVLSALFMLCLVINLLTIHWISRSECTSAAVSRQKQDNHQIDAHSTELQVMERVHSVSEREAETDEQIQPAGSMTVLGKDRGDAVSETNPGGDTQEEREDTVDTDTDLEINDIYDMITDVLDKGNGSDSHEI